MADIYDRVSPSVANIYDITQRSMGAGGAAAVEQPEGNGSGFVWDKGEAQVASYMLLRCVVLT